MPGAREDLGVLLGVLDAELAWLAADGYAETGRTVAPPVAEVAYSGAHGLLHVRIDARSGAVVRLAPQPMPSLPSSPGAEPEWVTLEALLGAHRLPTTAEASFRTKLGLTPGGVRQILTSYLRSLRGLRALALAGDWSLLEHARCRRPVGDQYLAFLREELSGRWGEPVAAERGAGAITVAFTPASPLPRARISVTVDWGAGRLSVVTAPPGDGPIDRRRMRVTPVLDAALDLAPPLTAERLGAVRACLAGLPLDG